MIFKHNNQLNIKEVSSLLLSSPYGNNEVYGQPLGFKTIAFVKIILSNDQTGFGETYAGIYSPEIVPCICRYLNERLSGKNVEDLLNNFHQRTFIPFVGFEGIINSVKAALYISLLDAYSISLEIPIYKLFNADLKPLNVYVSGGSVGMNSNQILDDANHQMSKGFNYYKLRVGLECKFQEDLFRLEKALTVFNNSNTVAVDFIQGTLASNLNVNDLKTRIKELNQYNLLWIEEITEPSKINKLKNIIGLSLNKLATGEAYSNLIPFHYLFETNSIDIAQYDVTHTGSFVECLEISEIARSYNKMEVLHVWGSYGALYSNAIFNLINPSISFLEYPSVEFQLSKEIDRVGHSIKNGEFIFNQDFLGIGIGITENTINKFPYIKGSAYQLPKNHG